MMFITVWCIFSFTWMVWLYVLLSCNNVDMDEYMYMNVDNGHDYVLVLIVMMLVELLWWWCWWIIYVYVHICCWWILLHATSVDLMVYACVEICWCWLLKLCEHMHCCCWVIRSCTQNMLLMNTLYSIMRVDMMFLLHHGVTTSEVIWYHMYIGVVSRGIA